MNQIILVGLITLLASCGKPTNSSSYDRCTEDASAECCSDSECSDGYICQVTKTHSCYELCDTGDPDFTCEEDEMTCSLVDFRGGDAITTMPVCN